MKEEAHFSCREWHVSCLGDDRGDGSMGKPLSRIQLAAERAMPGDTIYIHAGTYRERIDPPRGGNSDEQRIVYCSAGDGLVEIKGSEVVDDWTHLGNGVWTTRVQNLMFGDFNPYKRTISGHWFYPKGRVHHPGAVYFEGHWLIEAANREELVSAPPASNLWFAEVHQEFTQITARFGGRDPLSSLVEINVRETVFYPSMEGRNFLTLRGLTLLHAATPWAPPTTEQVGLVGCHWARGWIIEDCVVRYSACSGITLGKYHDPEDFPDQPVVEHTNGEDTFHGTIRRALAHGWSFDSVGGHVIRNCVVSHCEMAGICGSLGAPRSVIEGNTIHDIHVHRLFNGFEQAGIKFHGAIDTRISGNRIFRCHRGIWLDWMSQGTRVSGNVCHANGPEPDLFAEVNHGPFLVDGNFFLSDFSLLSQSDGGIYAGNVFLGRVHAIPEPTRVTPYFEPHSTRIAGWSAIPLGDDSYAFNLFADPEGLSDYDKAEKPVRFVQNVFVNGARPSIDDGDAICLSGVEISLEEHEGTLRLVGVTIRCSGENMAEEFPPALLSGVLFEGREGKPLVMPNVRVHAAQGTLTVIWPPLQCEDFSQ